MTLSDIFRTVIYTVGLAPKSAIQGYVKEGMEDKLAILQGLVTSLFRRALTVYLGVRLLALVKKGLLTQGDVDAIYDAAVYIAGLIIIWLWTRVLVPLWQNRIWPWIQKLVGPVTTVCLLIVASLALVGCASTSGIYRNKAGDKLEVHSTRFLWQTERARIAMQTNGLPEVEINKT